MSDTFDYEYDPSFDNEPDEPDPLHYHFKLRFNSCVEHSEKLFKVVLCDGTELCIPKKICREVRKSTMYVHEETYHKIYFQKVGSARSDFK